MPQIDNPDALSQTLAGQIKELQRRMDELSAAPIGKVKFATAYNSPVLNPVITSTPSVMTTSVTVPPLATACAFSAFASGSGNNTTSTADYITVKVEVIYGSYDSYTYQSEDNIIAGRTGNLTVPTVDSFTFAPGGGTLTLKASINNGGSGSWTNTSINSIFAEGLFVFQY
jgi:hypothetical protein